PVLALELDLLVVDPSRQDHGAVEPDQIVPGETDLAEILKSGVAPGLGLLDRLRPHQTLLVPMIRAGRPRREPGARPGGRCRRPARRPPVPRRPAPACDSCGSRAPPARPPRPPPRHAPRFPAGRARWPRAGPQPPSGPGRRETGHPPEDRSRRSRWDPEGPNNETVPS